MFPGKMNPVRRERLIRGPKVGRNTFTGAKGEVRKVKTGIRGGGMEEGQR